MLNLLFGLTFLQGDFAGVYLSVACWSFVVGAVTMPLCCFLSSWKKPFRHLFFIPVISVLLGVSLTLFELSAQ